MRRADDNLVSLIQEMMAVDVPLGGSLGALKQLQQKLGIDLTSGSEPNEFTPSKL